MRALTAITISGLHYNVFYGWVSGLVFAGLLDRASSDEGRDRVESDQPEERFVGRISQRISQLISTLGSQQRAHGLRRCLPGKRSMLLMLFYSSPLVFV